MNKIAKAPINSVPCRPKKSQLCVVSLPKISAEIEIYSLEALETNQSTQLASQTKVPIKAHFSPIEPANQE